MDTSEGNIAFQTLAKLRIDMEVSGRARSPPRGNRTASRAWKARPGTPFSRDATSIAQLSGSHDRPLLSVGDRQGPMLRARGGHGRRGPTVLQRGSDGHKLTWRVRLILSGHLPRWQRRKTTQP
jgi:hypothetical protein